MGKTLLVMVMLFSGRAFAQPDENKQDVLEKAFLRAGKREVKQLVPSALRDRLLVLVRQKDRLVIKCSPCENGPVPLHRAVVGAAIGGAAGYVFESFLAGRGKKAKRLSATLGILGGAAFGLCSCYRPTEIIQVSDSDVQKLASGQFRCD